MLVYYDDDVDGEPVFIELNGHVKTRHDVLGNEYGDYIPIEGRLIHRSRLIAIPDDAITPAFIWACVMTAVMYFVQRSMFPEFSSLPVIGVAAGMAMGALYWIRDYFRARYFNKTP